MAAFLEAFAEYGTVSHACRASGVSRATVYRHREDHPEFAEQWAAVEESVSDDLEPEAVTRAKDGSDLLLIFLLKARRPHRYRESSTVNHTGNLSLEHVPYTDASDAFTAE